MRKSEIFGEEYYILLVVEELMSMYELWNDTERGKLKYLEKYILQSGW
jgi:hypothetical protein